MNMHALSVRPDLGARHQPPGARQVEATEPQPTSRVGRTDRALMAVLALLCMTFLVTTLVRPPGEQWVWADLWVYALTFLCAALLCLRRAVRQREQRSAWLFLGASLVVYDVGNLVYGLYAHDSTSYVWAPDIFWLAFFPLAYTGILLLLRSTHGFIAGTAWLDGVIVVTGIGALGYALAFNHLFILDGPNLLAAVINFAYPLGDLLLLATVAWALGSTKGRLASMWTPLAGGMAVFVLVDTLYALQLNDGSYVLGSPLDALWPVAGLLIGFAAVCPDRRETGTTAGEVSWWWLVGPPTVFTVASAALLGYAAVGNPVPTLATALALACLVTLIPRAALTYWQMGRLAESHKQALTDELTGLPNRRALMRGLDARLSAREDAGRIAVFMVDLDHFKEVNDSLGHAVGDELLRLVGKRMRSCLREEDLFARIGGDEFAAVISLDASAPSAEPVAQRMLRSFSSSFELEAISLHMAISIGIAICPDDADEPSSLLRHSDVAMYEAKRRRTGYQTYCPATDTDMLDGLRTVEELRRALADDGLTVYYQPKVDLRTDTVRGVEALVRWEHPVHGVLLPDQFLPLAEKHGLMHLVLDRVLDAALAQIRSWREQGLDLTVAVNISTSNLMDIQLPAKVHGVLLRHGVLADRLTLEVTENTIMADPLRAKSVVSELSARGIHVSVDDYGTGYSSLTYLKDLAVRELKLDRTFVADFGDDPDASAIVSSTVNLAHALGLFMVAEGVDSPQAARALTALGCDVAQGYLYSRPVPGAQLTEWLLARGGARGNVAPAQLSGSGR